MFKTPFNMSRPFSVSPFKNIEPRSNQPTNIGQRTKKEAADNRIVDSAL